MAPEAAGRRCARCDTVVIDLTGLTEAEARAQLRQAVGRACVRMNAAPDGAPRFARRRSARRALGALLALGLTSGARASSTIEAPAPTWVAEARALAGRAVARLQQARRPPEPPSRPVMGGIGPMDVSELEAIGYIQLDD